MKKKKLLLDECVTHKLRNHFDSLETYTTSYMGWDGIKNGKLLQLAVDNEFEIFVTTDKNLQFQQNMTNYNITVVLLNAPIVNLRYLVPLVAKFFERIDSFEKHKIYVIG